MHYYWAALFRARTVISLGFRSSVQKNSLSGEGRHKGLVPRSDVLTSGFILYNVPLHSDHDPCMNIFFLYNVPPPLQKPRSVANQ